jgi:hypothetical protein
MTAGVDNRLPSVLYADLFYSNPGAAEFRQDHLEVWIQIYLANCGGAVSQQLARDFETAHPGCQVDTEVLEVVLKELAEGYRLQTVNGKHTLTASGLAAVESAKRRYANSRKRLLDRLFRLIEDATHHPLSEEESLALGNCAERLLIAALLDERGALEKLYAHPDDFGGLTSRAQERQQQLSDCMRTSLPAALATRIIELRRTLLLGIGELQGDEKAYLHTLHRSVLGSFFLIQDPHHTENIRSVIHKRCYYLDSNVYFAWLYKSQTAHPIVRPLLERLREHGVALCLLPETVEEIRRIEGDARRAALKAESDPQLASFLLRKRKAISADYLTARATDRNLTFQLWARFFTGVDQILSNIGATVAPVEFEEHETFMADAGTFRNAVKGQKEDAGRLPREEAIEHDVLALLKLAKLQLRGERDAWGSRIRFLSLDSSLNPTLGEIRNVLNRRYEWVDSPFTLARVVLPAAAHELARDEYENYVVTSIQHDLGLMMEMRGYSDFYFIDKLDKAGLPVKTILDAPIEMIEPVLVELQGRTGLSRKLDQALTTVDRATRQALVTELSREIADAIAFRSELQSDTERKLIEEQEARDKLSVDLAELSSKFNELSTQLSLQQKTSLASLDRVRSVEQIGQELEHNNQRLRRQRQLLGLIMILVLLVAAGGLLLFT